MIDASWEIAEMEENKRRRSLVRGKRTSEIEHFVLKSFEDRLRQSLYSYPLWQLQDEITRDYVIKNFKVNISLEELVKLIQGWQQP